MHANTLAPEELQHIDAYWRAANYLAVGQIYLFDNPLLKRPLVLSDIKRLLLGHWGTTPGQNFIYVHLNRVIRKFDLDMIYVSGPGHGGPAVVGNTYLEGTYSEVYPHISRDEAGLPVVFAFHGYPCLIHRPTYRRTNHGNLHVRGYKEEGTITTPFDMTVLNDLDRFHLVIDTIDRLPRSEPGAALQALM